MILLLPVRRDGAVAIDKTQQIENPKDCGGDWICEMGTRSATAPPKMRPPRPMKFDDLGYDDTCPAFYGKGDKTTLLKWNKEGVRRKRWDEEVMEYAIANSDYPGTCGASGTRTGGMRFGASIAPLGDID